MENTINWNFDNSYSRLPDTFKEHIKPIAVKNPELLIINESLAKELELDLSKINKDRLSALFTGNILPKGSDTIAQAYAGHQFGHFTMLGDGRAILIGEHLTSSNRRYDVQFKGSGKTSFSRNGDGRAALGPMLREYIISEAMNALNIPTTRSLAVVKTGEEVLRDKKHQGAILTRIASSHLRVGTFQYVSARQNINELEIIFDYTIDRHYPEIRNTENPALDLLEKVIVKQCDLIVNWMRVGFIHGVMNTDNMTISGETIDYGPCAFMDTYDPKTVFSSIDQMGRYAYCNQPGIAKWNLARFAECLIPLVDKDIDKAIKLVTQKVNSFEITYKQKWMEMMRNKLGLFSEEKNDNLLFLDLLTWMHQNKADYTNTFCHLMDPQSYNEPIYKDVYFEDWKKNLKIRQLKNNNSYENSIELMKNNNPLIIPRNHKVEEVLALAERNDFKLLTKFLKILTKPYTKQEDTSDFQSLLGSSENYKTFCGT